MPRVRKKLVVSGSFSKSKDIQCFFFLLIVLFSIEFMFQVQFIFKTRDKHETKCL